ncbi:MAG TPA: hypothetical protein VEK14_03925, partial [Rhodomicrobium sp.]|nr:hypothetical protein [Rhodomicrobium sp.]
MPKNKKAMSAEQPLSHKIRKLQTHPQKSTWAHDYERLIEVWRAAPSEARREFILDVLQNAVELREIQDSSQVGPDKLDTNGNVPEGGAFAALMDDAALGRVASLAKRCTFTRDPKGVLHVAVPLNVTSVTYKLDSPIFRKWLRGQAHEHRAV